MKRENEDHTAAEGFINMNYRIRQFSKHLSEVNLIQEKGERDLEGSQI